MDPLLRRAPGFVLRRPGWSLAIAAAVACFGLAGVTVPLLIEASADRSFRAEADAAARAAQVGRGLDARTYTTDLDEAQVIDAVTEALDDLDGMGRPVIEVSPLAPYTDRLGPLPTIRSAAGDDAIAVVYAFDDAVPNGTEGVWVPDGLAASLGISAGDTVDVGLVRTESDGESTATPVRVAGVYPTADGLPAIEGIDWAAAASTLPVDPAGTGEVANLLLAAPAVAAALIQDMGDESFTRWKIPWEGDVTLARARVASDDIDTTAATLQDVESLLGGEIAATDSSPVVLTSGVGAFVARADGAASTLRPMVEAIAITAQVMSAMVVVMSAWLLTASRRREHLLAVAMGRHPVAVGTMLAVELFAATLLGVGLAAAVVRWRPSLVVGNGALQPSTVSDAATTVWWTLPLALVVIAAVGWIGVWRMQADTGGRLRRASSLLHPETIVVVLAVATGLQLATQRGSALDAGSSLLFPLFTSLAGAALVAAALRFTVRHTEYRAARLRATRGFHRPRSLAWWMAARRLTLSLRETSALLVVIGAGAALFVYCDSVGLTGERGVADKAAAFGGAPATAAIADTGAVPHDDDGFPAGLPPGDTVIWTVTGVHPAPDVVADLVVVDPATFSDAATWRDSFADESFDELMGRLGDSPPNALNLVVAGAYNDLFPDRGTLLLDFGLAVPYNIVGRIAAAPWLRERSSLLLADARAMIPRLPDEEDPRPGAVDLMPLDDVFRTFVWSSGSQVDLDRRLGARGLDVESMNVPTAERQPSFVAYMLSLPYLRIVGFGLLLVALAAIAVLGSRRRAELAAEVAMTDAMGLPRRTGAAAVALGAVAVGLVGVMTGVLIARVLVEFMTERLDPGPSFSPPLTAQLSWRAVWIAAVAVTLVSVGAALLELRGARRAPTAEVMRGAE